MSEVKHTAGPWHFTDDYNAHVIRAKAKEDRVYGDLLASIWGGHHEANARLIASAPTMLEALAHAEALLAFHEGSAKPQYDGAEPTVRLNGDDLAAALLVIREAIAKATGATT